MGKNWLLIDKLSGLNTGVQKNFEGGRQLFFRVKVSIYYKGTEKTSKSPRNPKKHTFQSRGLATPLLPPSPLWTPMLPIDNCKFLQDKKMKSFMVN